MAFFLVHRQQKTHFFSDWDIGVYFQPKEYMELEAKRDFSQEGRIWEELVNILKTNDVDLIILNRARLDLVYTFLAKVIPLKIAKRKLYLDLLCKTSYEAIDWWDFVEVFWKIKEKAKSLSKEAKKETCGS